MEGRVASGRASGRTPEDAPRAAVTGDHLGLHPRRFREGLEDQRLQDSHAAAPFARRIQHLLAESTAIHAATGAAEPGHALGGEQVPGLIRLLVLQGENVGADNTVGCRKVGRGLRQRDQRRANQRDYGQSYYSCHHRPGESVHAATLPWGSVDVVARRAPR